MSPVANAHNAQGWPTFDGAVPVGGDGGQIVGGTGAHDQPTPVGAKPRSTFWDATPLAKFDFDHFENLALRYDGERDKRRRLINVHKDNAAATQSEMDIMEREYQRAGKSPPDWRKPYQETIANEKAKIAEHEAAIATLPRSRVGDLQKAARKFGPRKRNRVERPDVGDLSCEDATARLHFAKDNRASLESTLGRADSEIAEIIRAECERRVEAGAITFTNIINGTIDCMFYPQRQAMQTIPGVGPFMAEMEDAFGMALFLDDGTMVDRMVEKAIALNTGRKKVTASERARLIAEADARVMEARRVLEACVRRDEAQGMIRMRERDTPPEVLLWIE